MNKNLLRKLELLQPVSRDIVNQYKRRDVFRCTHESHLHFNSAVSVYHVLKEKQCFPDGCISFAWRCKKFEKRQACHRKFKHVGRSCTSCPSFFDIKVIRKPEIILSQPDYKQFQRELSSFEDWVTAHQGKIIEFTGTINSVKPRLSLKKRGRNNYVMLEGFLLNVVDGAVNDKRLNDFMYIPVSTRMQGRQEFSCGDMICLTGSLDTKKGSLRLRAIRSYEIIQRGEPCYWTAGRARVAQKTGTVLSYQTDKCHRCDKGILMDIHRESRRKRGDPRRTLFCLEGVAEPDFCSYHIRQKLSRDTCPQDEPEDESAGK